MFIPQSSTITKMRKSLVNRFWNKFNKPPNSCWEWQGSLDKYGYGKIQKNERCKFILAHQVAWMLWYGPIPERMCVLHKCDNRKCVNPKHLFLGNRADNCNDRHDKKRDAKYERNGTAKLTNTEVKKIRDLYKTGKYLQKDLANLYNISRCSLSHIINNKKWKNL